MTDSPAQLDSPAVPEITLRDYFAAKAMQAALAYRRNQFETDNDDQETWDYAIEQYVAPEAYAIADAMLRARAK